MKGACRPGSIPGTPTNLKKKLHKINRNIERLRNKLGLTQDGLARQADIKYATFMKIESGTANKPNIQTMTKIVKALSVSIEDLIK